MLMLHQHMSVAQEVRSGRNLADSDRPSLTSTYAPERATRFVVGRNADHRLTVHRSLT